MARRCTPAQRRPRSTVCHSSGVPAASTFVSGTSTAARLRPPSQARRLRAAFSTSGSSGILRSSRDEGVPLSWRHALPRPGLHPPRRGLLLKRE